MKKSMEWYDLGQQQIKKDQCPNCNATTKTASIDCTEKVIDGEYTLEYLICYDCHTQWNQEFVSKEEKDWAITTSIYT